MRPFQISKDRWVNLNHVTSWMVVEGKVKLDLVNSDPLSQEWSVSFEGEYAERFIQRMEMLAQGNFL